MSLIERLHRSATPTQSTLFHLGMLLLVSLAIANASTLREAAAMTGEPTSMSEQTGTDILVVRPAALAGIVPGDDGHEDASEPLAIDGLGGLDPIVTLMPVDLAHITSQFGHRTDPFKQKRAFHAGIDFGAPRGTPVRAVADGVVVTSTTQRSYGKVVVIKHEHGYRTLYAHNSTLLVKAGQVIHAGDTIARVGSTGRSTGSHLHFEVHRSGERVDPSPYLVGL
ncbi:M23 family metallopeptidase [Dyella sp. OK004]|uniref:M23 family metallopeptidase n=1 Tax=Dyella sp. OK004 TaxID=1855292 RepID=UPI0011601CDB|nr:M23 family metallopeptidase [Dyella sp. OK004]